MVVVVVVAADGSQRFNLAARLQNHRIIVASDMNVSDNPCIPMGNPQISLIPATPSPARRRQRKYAFPSIEATFSSSAQKGRPKWEGRMYRIF